MKALWEGCIAFAFGMTLGLAAQGCAATNEAEKAVREAAYIVHAASPLIVERYEYEQNECMKLGSEYDRDLACVRAVRAKYEPVRKALASFREAWCALDEAIGSQECAR